jgi:hypothetical protein
MAKKDSEFKPKVSVVGYYVNSTSEFIDLLCGFKAETDILLFVAMNGNLVFCAASLTVTLHTRVLSYQPCLVISIYLHLLAHSSPLSLLYLTVDRRQEERWQEQEASFGIHALQQGASRQDQGRPTRPHLRWHRQEVG